MTKRQDLYLQRRSRSEQSDQRQPNQAKNISHQPRASPNSTPLTSRIEFPTMTGSHGRLVELYAALLVKDELAGHGTWRCLNLVDDRIKRCGLKLTDLDERVAE